MFLTIFAFENEGAGFRNFSGLSLAISVERAYGVSCGVATWLAKAGEPSLERTRSCHLCCVGTGDMAISNSETFKFLPADVICKPITSQQTIPLRHSVLWPDEDVAKVVLPEDELGWHFGAFVPSQVEPIAVISLFSEPVPMSPIDSTLDRLATDDPAEGMATRFRKFACDPLFQGRGIGTKLLTYVFHFAHLDLHAGVVWCDARVSASTWYRKRSMTAFGNSFFKGAVEYVRMRIDLEPLTPSP